MSKTITREVWNNLRYPVSLHQMPDDEGGYWLAGIPLLGEGMFIADGDTPQEAIEALEERRRRFYDAIVASGKPISLPSDAVEKLEMPSGKWLQRTSPSFHAELREAARTNNLSLNEYCNQCLQRGHAVQSMYSAAEQAFAKISLATQQIIEDAVGRVQYRSPKPNNSDTLTFSTTPQATTSGTRKTRSKKAVPTA